MLPELTARLLDDWSAAFGDTRRPRRIDYVGLPGAIEGGTTTFLAVAPSRRRPLFAVKVHRDADAGPRARNEQRILDFLHARCADLAPSLPRVVLCDRVAGSWVLVQTIVEGQAMGITLDAAGVPVLAEAERNLRAIADWLARLHATRMDATGMNAGPIASASQNLAQFHAAFPFTDPERALLVDIEAALPAAIDRSQAVTHGDFCRHNVLVSEGLRFGVVDWTDAAPAGLPLHDLLFFLSTYFIQVRRQTGLEGIRHAFFETFYGQSAYAALVRDLVAAYCARLGVIASLREQLGLFLVCQALREREKLERLGRTSASPRITLWLAGVVGAEYEEARRASFWLYLFRELSRQSA